jgi:hypothetical protein
MIDLAKGTIDDAVAGAEKVETKTVGDIQAILESRSRFSREGGKKMIDLAKGTIEDAVAGAEKVETKTVGDIQAILDRLDGATLDVLGVKGAIALHLSKPSS